MVESIDVVLSTQLEVTAEAQIIVVRDHSVLENLDYENSGHTGFASREYADTELAKKVDKVEGKGLSANDYTNEEKSKLNNVEENANKVRDSVSSGYYNIEDDLIPNLNSRYSELKEFCYISYDCDGALHSYNSSSFLFHKEYAETGSEIVYKYYLTNPTIDYIYKVEKITDYENNIIQDWTITRYNSFGKKVDKVSGKGLSTNDFTNTDKNQITLNKESIQTLETQLALYQFTRQQIVAKYLTEYSAFVNDVVTIENMADKARRHYEFLNQNPVTWNWLKQWLISCRTDYETNPARLELFLGGDETFWVFEVQAFLGESHRDDYPGSTDYTIDSYANGWRPSSTIEILDERVTANETKLSKIKFFVGDTDGLEDQLIADYNVSHNRDYILYYGNCEDNIGTRNCIAIGSFFSNQICCVEIDHKSLTYLLCDNPGSETPIWQRTNMIYNMNSNIARKVDIIAGKGLSTNDFTDDYRNKLDDTLVGDNLDDAIDNEMQQRLFDGDTIDDELLPDSVKNVIEFTKQVTGSDFMAQILATELGTIVWIAANKSYTGDTYYRKFAINVDGTQSGLQLFDPKENTIYVGKTDNNCYKWTGTNLVEVSKSIGLGESSTTAYAGNKGKANRQDIDTLLVRVPTPPITAGTYKLQVVVDANGNPTFSWVV